MQSSQINPFLNFKCVFERDVCFYGPKTKLIDALIVPWGEELNTQMTFFSHFWAIDIFIAEVCE